MIFLVDGNPDFERVEADCVEDAEAKLNGVGTILGELVEEIEAKFTNRAGFQLTEVKFADDGEPMTFKGYGAVFNNVDQGGDKIMPGAFMETLAGYKSNGRLPQMLYNHGPMGGGPTMPVGVWTKMQEDAHGLQVEGKLFDHSIGRDLYVALKGGAIGGLSIGYRVKEAAKGNYQNGERRVIKAAHLVEVSLVNDPMNPEARFTAVKSAEQITTIREYEDFLRDVAKFSATQAKALASGGWKAFEAKRDAGEGLDEVAELIRRNIQLLTK